MSDQSVRPKPRRTPLVEHPLTSFFDAVATGRIPTDDQVDELAADVVRGSKVPAASVARTITDTVEQMRSALAEGNAGQARSTARTVAQRLYDQLPDYTRPDPNAGKPISEIVASIPRSVA